MKNILIFTIYPRSGSSILCEILSNNLNIENKEEFFNDSYSNILLKLKEIKNTFVAKLHSKNLNYNETNLLLKQFDVFGLKRQNELNSILSREISFSLNQWANTVNNKIIKPDLNSLIIPEQRFRSFFKRRLFYNSFLNYFKKEFIYENLTIPKNTFNIKNINIPHIEYFKNKKEIYYFCNKYKINFSFDELNQIN
jgi:hypothetical protein